jgi:hypothetical protein
MLPIDHTTYILSASGLLMLCKTLMSAPAMLPNIMPTKSKEMVSDVRAETISTNIITTNAPSIAAMICNHMLPTKIAGSSELPKSSKATPNQFLTQLHVVLKEQQWVHNIKYLKTARIPIIKLTTNETYKHIQIDISIEDNTHYGLKCVDLVKQYLTEYEVLEPLVFATKTLLKLSYLNDPYKGGISSYGLILMIVSFLQTQKRSGLDISVSQNNLGKLFFDCVNYYGLQFDPAKFIIYARKTEDDENDEINLQVSIYIYM